MAVRIKDWMIPYTWWQWIEITNNHVINVLLRKFNNLIQVNGDRELYVDLQLPEWIQPDDDFPVWVTTGKILAEDWWYQSWIILNWKTTSWDYIRFIYANDWHLYYDPWTWVWIEFWTWWGWVQINVATASTLWIIKLGTDTKQTIVAELPSTEAWRTYPVQLNADNQAVVNIPWTDTTYTAGTNVSIDQNNEISVTLPNVLVYKGTVQDLSDLPASWTVWDTYFVEWEDWMYSWDWTKWSYVWWTWIDTSNFFDKTVDTSDDITQGTTNLFVTQQEKNTWNGKQDPISAWDGIDITNNVVSNTLPFDPDNAGSLGQFLKKTNDGYAWADIPWWWGGWGSSYTAWDGIDITNNVISNTAMFNPINQGRTGQVLKKSGPNTYYWADESWGGGWWDSNVKLFTLEDDEDIATAQEALDWYNQWNLPILRIETTITTTSVSWTVSTQWLYDYYPEPYLSYNNKLVFVMIENANVSTIVSSEHWDFTSRRIPNLVLDHTDGEVTNIGVWFQTESRLDYLSPNTQYTNPYQPQYPWSPATKKYVDDRNWTWTLSQYNALTTIDPDVVYNITSLN